MVRNDFHTDELKVNLKEGDFWAVAHLIRIPVWLYLIVFAQNKHLSVPPDD